MRRKSNQFGEHRDRWMRSENLRILARIATQVLRICIVVLRLFDELNT